MAIKVSQCIKLIPAVKVPIKKDIHHTCELEKYKFMIHCDKW